MKKLTKCLWLLVPLQYHLLTSMHLCPYGAVLYDQLTEKEKDGIWCSDGSTIYISIKQKVTAEALQTLSVTNLRDTGKGKLLQWAKLWTLCRVIYFVWKD